MLNTILSKMTCADCRYCCVFDASDLWEMPLLDAETQKVAAAALPDARFTSNGEDWLFQIAAPHGEDTVECPAHTDHGCALGEKAPFECRLWPMRVMRFAGRKVIALSPNCETIAGMPVGKVAKCARGLAQKIFAYAAAHPSVVKEYRPEYVILVTEE